MAGSIFAQTSAKNSKITFKIKYIKKPIAIKQGRSEDYLKAGNENFEDLNRVKLNEM